MHVENYDDDSDKGYVLEVDVEYPKNCVVHIRSLKQALNHGLVLKGVHKVIQFNQEAWLKEYVDMNTELRKQAKNDFEKISLS